MLYQLINETRLDYNSILIGFPLGLVLGVLELFWFPKAEIRFRRWSFTRILFFKTMWEVAPGLENSNGLKTFFLFQERLRRNSENYFKKFGIKPEFKAGLHFGKVVSAQIGDLKREIVYNGGVLNTTARIQNECNKYQRTCLVSGTLMQRLRETNGFQWERIDTVTLRGKETEVELFSVVDAHSISPAVAL